MIAGLWMFMVDDGLLWLVYGCLTSQKSQMAGLWMFMVDYGWLMVGLWLIMAGSDWMVSKHHQGNVVGEKTRLVLLLLTS